MVANLLHQIPPPTTSSGRMKLYSSFVNVAPTANGLNNGIRTVNTQDRTPDSSHGGHTPSKPPSRSGISVIGESTD